jgi:hypothetical protein
VAENAPVVVGLNAAENVQLTVAASVAPHVFAVRTNGPAAPLKAIDEMSSVAVPVFFSVTVCAADCTPIVSVPNGRLVADNDATGVPVPVTVTVKTLEVEAGYDLLPEKVAVIEFALAASDDPLTESEHVPLLMVHLPSAVVPALKLAVPASPGAGPVKSVGAPPVIVAVREVDWAEVSDVSEAPTLVVLVNALFQFVSRLFTFSVPMPVTSS